MRSMASLPGGEVGLVFEGEAGHAVEAVVAEDVVIVHEVAFQG